MTTNRYLDELQKDASFHYQRLDISGIDNEPVASMFGDAVLEQESCLFAPGTDSGDAYLASLHLRVTEALDNRKPLPVARFADGEYAFYNFTLGCNGLYRQAQSIGDIRQAIPMHAAALMYLAEVGLLAPLVHPGNSHRKPSGLLSFFKKKPDSGGADFLDFLREHGIALHAGNYVPFYATYAYLTSARFAKALDGKKLAICNSDFNEASCRAWFEAFDSRPHIHFVAIEPEYVATRWEHMKPGILAAIPKDADLCLTGAGVGALLICADAARNCSIPVIDAGHVLNMMNDRVDKSNGLRLYTVRKPV